MTNVDMKTFLFALILALAACSDDTVDSTDAGQDARASMDQGTPDTGNGDDLGTQEDQGVSDMGAPDMDDCVAITHDPVERVEIANDIQISAEVSGANSVNLRWRLAGTQDFETLSMPINGSVSEATIPSENLTFAGVEYIIDAEGFNCTRSLPPEGTYFVDVYGEYQITKERETYEYLPDVDGQRVVYADEKSGGGDDIRLFDLHTFQFTDVTSDALAQGVPRISGDNVIYVQTLNQQSDVYLHDLSSGQSHRLTNNDLSQYGAEIDGHIVVWRDDRNMSGALNGDIYAFDLGPDATYGTADDVGEIPLVTALRDQTAPKVSVVDGRVRIVWASLTDDADGICDANCDWNIYLYDFGPDGVHGTADDIGPTRITSQPNEQTSPVISGTRIAWLDARGGNWLDPDIWWLDLGPDGLFGTADDIAAAELDIPVDDPDDLAIDGDRMVWHDYRGGSFEVYVWDFVTSVETQITAAESGQFESEISGRNVVWQDTRNNPMGELFDDIYVYVLPAD